MTTHAEPSGAELHRAYERAFEERDRQALLNLIAEDAQWHVFGDSAFAGTIRGRDAIWEKFAAPQWDTPRQMEVHEVLESEDHIVVLGEVSFSQPGGASRFKTVEVYHYDGGQLTERWFFVDRRRDLDALLDRIAAADGPDT